LKNHFRSEKHSLGKRKLDEKDVKEKDIAVAPQKHDELLHPTGETLPESMLVFRVKVVTSFLKAGVPLSKIECFRPLLEEVGVRLTDRCHLADLIPFILN